MYETKIDRYIFKMKQLGESPLGKPIGRSRKKGIIMAVETKDSDGDITGFLIHTKSPG